MPAGAGQVRCDRLVEADVGVGGDHPDTGQAADDEVGEELVPRPVSLVATRMPRTSRCPSPVDAGGDATDPPALHAWLRGEGFARGYEWTENSPVTIEERMWDTAFVERHADGRELDVHVVHNADGLVRLATTDPWEFTPDILSY